MSTLLLGMAAGAAAAAAAGWLLATSARRRQARTMSGLLHDLKTPLSSIIAYTEILQEGEEDPAQGRRFLGIIREEASRMLGMLDPGSRPARGEVPARPTVAPRSGSADARTVLVVDDDRYLREALRTALANRGYRTMVAGGGEEALSRARGDRPDVILMDLLMPEMSGDEVLRKLRADPATRGIPVIITTGDAARQELAGAAAVLTKPVSPEVLIAAVERALPGGNG